MRGIRRGIESIEIPPPVPVNEPMSADRPPADYEDGGPALQIRVTMPDLPGGEPRAEYVAPTGLARQVLVERAVPLLARARYVLDEIADPSHGAPCPVWARDRAESMANAIADLIGHSTTDAPPAPELEAVLADGTRAPMPETRAEKAARHERINEALDRMGITVIPTCPMAPYERDVSDWEREREAAVPFMGEQPTPHVCQFCEVPLAIHGPACPTESSESATPTPDDKKWGSRFGGRPYACDGCGASPHDGVYCLSPDGRHTWRPLDGPSNDEMLAAPTVKKQPDDVPLSDDLDPALIAVLRAAGDQWGALGVAEAAAGMTDQTALIRHLTWPKSREPAAPVQPMRTGVAALDARDEQLCREINALQAAQAETLQARATRLDRERNEAGARYREAIQAADEAWRAIGGRP